MKNRGVTDSLLFILILVILIGVLTSKPIDAQSIPKPSAPEFTMRYMEQSYTTPQTNSSNGAWTIPSMNTDGPLILFTIKNQPLSQLDNNGTLYYNFRSMTTRQNSWNCYPFEGNRTTKAWGVFSSGMVSPAYTIASNNPSIVSSNTDYTLIPINLHRFTGEIIPNSTLIEIQLQALYGSINPIEGSVPRTPYGETEFYYQFTGESSDWSSSQIIDLATGLVSTSSPSPSPSVPELSWLLTLPLFLSIISVAVAIKHRKQVKKV
jgi:hypothetical protein